MNKMVSMSKLPKGGGYNLIAPDAKGTGKSAEKWLEEWSKWFVRNNRDELNEKVNPDKGYVMLRGQMRGQGGYSTPLVIPLKIKAKTILCFPLLCTLSSSNWEPNRKSELNSAEKLKIDAEKDNKYQFMHHVSVTIDGEPIINWRDNEDREKVVARSVTTPMFDIDVDADDWRDYEGPQQKKIDEIELTAGEAKAVCSGILFLVNLKQREQPYILRIRAGGVRDYYIHAVYTIQVD